MAANVLGTMIEVRPESGSDTTVELLPLAVIAGRVVDQYGDPLERCVVRALKKTPAPGYGEYYDGFASATTDDRGEYRIFDVEPGKYYIAAEYNSERNGIARPSRFRWPQMGGIVLFPDTSDIAAAQQAEASAGQTTRITDLRLNIRRAVTISGHIKPAPLEAALNLQHAGVRLGLNESAILGERSKADGSFSYSVLPGKYVLSVLDQKTGKMSPGITIDAVDKDVTGIELKLTTSYELNGRMTVDGPETLDFSKLALNFFSAPIQIDVHGSFHANVFFAKTRWILQGLPENWYVKSVSVGGRRLMDKTVELEPGTTDIVFVLSARGGQVNINVTGTGLESLSVVVLLPDTGPLPEIESILHAAPDTSGMLVVHGVPPGSYRVFALNALAWPLAMRPDLLMQNYGKSAPVVTVSPGERKSIVVAPMKILPADH